MGFRRARHQRCHQRSTFSRSCPGQRSDCFGKGAWCQSRPVWSKPAGLPGPQSGLHSVTALQFLPEPVRQLRVKTDAVENEGSSGRVHVLSSAMPASTEARRSTLIQPLPACPSSAHHQGWILLQWHFHQRHVQAYSAHGVPLSVARPESKPPKIHIFPLASRTAE